MDVVVAILLLVQQPDPADQLRRQELSLRLGDLAVNGKFDALARETLRELRGRKIDASGFDMVWKIVALRRWEDGLPGFLAAWDKAAATEAPSPAQALFRARLQSLEPKSKSYRDLLESAAIRFPGEPVLLWFLARARFDAGERGAAARALEEMTPVKGWSWDADEYHRMLVAAYAESGSTAAAVEHFRALREDRNDANELAEFALKCKLTTEAARCYRLVVEEDPDRTAGWVGLILALRSDGDVEGANAERRRMIAPGGVIAPLRLEEYFYRLPAAGKAEEMCRTLQEVLTWPRTAHQSVRVIGLTVPPDERTPIGTLWEGTAKDPLSWLNLALLREIWGGKPDAVLETLQKGEKLFPDDPRFAYERMRPLNSLQRFDEAAEAYARLVQLDPDGKRSGARPVAWLLDAIQGLTAGRKLGAALKAGVLALSEPGLDDLNRSRVREAMKPACLNSGAEFWDEIRKLKIPAAPADVTASARARLAKLADDDFEVRSEASKELRKLGLQAVPVLLEHLDDQDAEVRSKARELIRSILSD